MKMRNIARSSRIGAAVLTIGLIASACANTGEGGSGSDSSNTITFGVIPGWTDESATTYVAKKVLEDNGYTVEVTELSDNAPMYTALSQGDIDILTSGWIELTHKSYMDQYGENLEDLGTYFEGATSFLAVPTYMDDINSIEDLNANAAEFGDTVVGIEPGAGLTKMTQESVFPDYGLDQDFKLQLSSTPAMLTELEKATEAEEPIVVTLWKPFWANLKFPVKALEDPKGAYGEPENLHVIAREGFSTDHPEVAEMFANFKLDEEQFGTIEDSIVNEFGQGKEAEAADKWLADNPDYATALAAYLK